MNKSRAIAFVVATIVSTATIGGAQAASPRAPGSARAGQAANAGRHQKGLLRGVQLTDAEKSALKEVHGRYRSRSQSLRESLKPAMQEARAARQRGDTAAARAVLERTKDEREQLRTLMGQQTADLRAALTPANQRQFDANVQQASQRRAAKGKTGRSSKGHGRRRGRGIDARTPNA